MPEDDEDEPAAAESFVSASNGSDDGRSESGDEEVAASVDAALRSLVRLDVLLKMQIAAVEKSFVDRPVTEDEQSVFAFEKLRGKENYHQWRVLMQLCLQALQLWDGIEEDDSSDASPEDTRRDLRAYEYIYNSTTSSVQAHIERHQSGRTAWRTLALLYGEVTLLDRITMERRMCARMQQHDSLSNHIKSLLLAVDYLRAAGEPIDDSVVVRKILCSLPDSYDSFIRTLSSDQLASSSSIIQAVMVMEQL